MDTAYRQLTRLLPESALERYRFGLALLAYLFLVMSIPYVVTADAPGVLRVTIAGLYIIIAARWFQLSPLSHRHFSYTFLYL